MCFVTEGARGLESLLFERSNSDCSVPEISSQFELSFPRYNVFLLKSTNTYLGVFRNWKVPVVRDLGFLRGT